MTAVEDRLVPIIDAGRAIGEVPTLGSTEWTELDRRDARSTAAVARAALRWWRDGTPDVIRARLLDDLAEEDYRLAYRLRQASLDISAGFRADDVGGLMLDTPERRIAWYERNAEMLQGVRD